MIGPSEPASSRGRSRRAHLARQLTRVRHDLHLGRELAHALSDRFAVREHDVAPLEHLA